MIGFIPKIFDKPFAESSELLCTELSDSAPEFEFDRNVPFGVGKHYEFKTMLNSMAVGDSFEYLKSERATMLNVISLFDEKIFKTKKIDETTRRVWRLF